MGFARKLREPFKHLNLRYFWVVDSVIFLVDTGLTGYFLTDMLVQLYTVYGADFATFMYTSAWLLWAVSTALDLAELLGFNPDKFPKNVRMFRDYFMGQPLVGDALLAYTWWFGAYLPCFTLKSVCDTDDPMKAEWALENCGLSAGIQGCEPSMAPTPFMWGTPYPTTEYPTSVPTSTPWPTLLPTVNFSTFPPTSSSVPTGQPSFMPTISFVPSPMPTASPTFPPTSSPTFLPTLSLMPSPDPTPFTMDDMDKLDTAFFLMAFINLLFAIPDYPALTLAPFSPLIFNFFSTWILWLFWVSQIVLNFNPTNIDFSPFFFPLVLGLSFYAKYTDTRTWKGTASLFGIPLEGSNFIGEMIATQILKRPDHAGEWNYLAAIEGVLLIFVGGFIMTVRFIVYFVRLVPGKGFKQGAYEAADAACSIFATSVCAQITKEVDDQGPHPKWAAFYKLCGRCCGAGDDNAAAKESPNPLSGSPSSKKEQNVEVELAESPPVPTEVRD
mmetsp:Transcript_27369/g.74179  ORF Transcript_27369/g.74179 Transcript_27369/m.74179 type:complete len:499 (-) Transcript_27369:186-1682(-)